MEQKNKKILYGLAALIVLGVSVRMVKTMQNQNHNTINLATAKGPEIARFINNNVDNGGLGPINIYEQQDQQNQNQHEGINMAIQLLQAIQWMDTKKGVAQKQIARWKQALKDNYFINADHFGRLYTDEEIANLTEIFIHLAEGAPDIHNIEEFLNVFTLHGGAPTQAFMEAARDAHHQAHHQAGQARGQDDGDDNQGKGHGSRTPSRSTSFSASSTDSDNDGDDNQGQGNQAAMQAGRKARAAADKAAPMASSGGAFQTPEQQNAKEQVEAAAAQQAQMAQQVAAADQAAADQAAAKQAAADKAMRAARKARAAADQAAMQAAADKIAADAIKRQQQQKAKQQVEAAAPMASSGGAFQTPKQQAAAQQGPAMQASNTAAAVVKSPLSPVPSSNTAGAGAAEMQSSGGALRPTKEQVETAVTRAQQKLSEATEQWNADAAIHSENLENFVRKTITNARKAIKQYEAGNYKYDAFSEKVKQLKRDTNKLQSQVMGNESMPEYKQTTDL
ncbi:hypothetical protein K9K77_00715 [Candidatus Babeliales bacterium]|nr:hypothetical protein [Candidatus Babeliales bacterium]